MPLLPKVNRNQQYPKLLPIPTFIRMHLNYARVRPEGENNNINLKFGVPVSRICVAKD